MKSSLVPVNSSNISGVSHNDGTLRVKYNNGKEYDYPGVDEDTYLGLLKADSKGSYIHNVIKPNYNAIKVEEDEGNPDNVNGG